ncbi:hypothetical protein [Streptomyces sp. NPDC056194]|uniref:hypothetical protein n=1 Tax=Streptomyces sp. NPDC056194 TaxID=3345744 RepID=UPI0035D658B7
MPAAAAVVLAACSGPAGQDAPYTGAGDVRLISCTPATDINGLRVNAVYEIVKRDDAPHTYAVTFMGVTGGNNNLPAMPVKKTVEAGKTVRLHASDYAFFPVLASQSAPSAVCQLNGHVDDAVSSAPSS